jgi:predicted small lipoprotein YifL
MTKKNMFKTIIIATIFSLVVAVSGCGLKGDPIPPQDVQKTKAQSNALDIKKDKDIKK